MGIIRNCIDIVGITPEEELPKEIYGQLIETSETENIYLRNDLNIKNIYQVIIDKSAKISRVINSPLNKIVVIDCIKRTKIAYYDNEDRMGVFEFKSLFNSFVDIDDDEDEIQKIDIHIADAIFELINPNTLYSYILYMIDIHYYSGIGKQKIMNCKTNIPLNYNDKERDKMDAITEVLVSGDTKNKDKKEDYIDIEAEYL